ncbi:MAG: peptidoglycan-binding domain-containing protein [Nocardioidaceae bacterium]
MARIPGTTWKPVERYQQGGSVATPMTSHRRVILHTAVSDADSLYPLFAQPGQATSHTYVARDGRTEQYIDTSIQSTANLEGNADGISVESWDHYPTGWAHDADVPKWTAAQLNAIAEICAWAHKKYGIPLQKLPSSRPGTRGIGWHRQGIDPWRESGGEVWSESTGKVCPGDRRVRQVGKVIRLARKVANVKPVSLNRLLRIAKHKHGKAYTKEGRRQVEVVVDALHGHGFSVEGHEHGHYDAALKRAVGTFQENQGWTGEDANGLVGPVTLNRLGIAFRKGRPNLLQGFTKRDTASTSSTA